MQDDGLDLTGQALDEGKQLRTGMHFSPTSGDMLSWLSASVATKSTSWSV